jgi:hypothetical protein
MQSPQPFSQPIPIDPSNDPVPLPSHPGSYKVGTISLEATDTSRIDPYAFTAHHRRLMFTFFYPTIDDQHPFAPYFSHPRLATNCDEADHLPYGTTARYQTHAYDHASVLATGPLPVILFSPGSGVLRESYTIPLEDLASEGYFCVSIGHTYDTDIHFSDGEIVWEIREEMQEEPDLRLRAQDAVFALQQLADGAFVGRIPGLGPQTLETGQVGMFGHSMGGIATLEAMGLDKRIVGGANLDGRFMGEQMMVGTDRPFLLISAAGESEESDLESASAVATTWPHLTGWKMELKINGALHMPFCDDAACYKLIGALSALDPKKKEFGTIDPLRMMAIQSCAEGRQ